MRVREHTYAIRLDPANAQAIADFEDISVGSVQNMIARDVRSVEHVDMDHFILFGYETTAGYVHQDWAIVNEKQLEENFEPVGDSPIDSEIVKVYYKN